MLEKADKILRTGSVADIQDFIPDLVNEYCKIDTQAQEQENAYEIERIRLYVKLKKEKKAKKNTYSDKDIDVIAKEWAIKKYWDHTLNKKLAQHYKLYIQELSQKKIDLQVLNKAMREGI